MRRCPFCNVDVSNEEESECGVFCPECHNNFWMSEALNDEPNK